MPRLGLRGSDHIEGLHGVAMGEPGGWGGKEPIPTTTFPQSIGLGQTWDTELVGHAAAAEGYEARYLFQCESYRRGGIVVRAPNADLGRDPRWGRTEECYGEDAFFNGAMTVAFVRGLQGDHPTYWQAASLMKHFLANSNEDGRESSSSDFDERLFREYYSVPFRRGIEAGSRAYMAAYNSYNGIPCAIHPILKEVTVAEWGQDGIICTDGGAMKLLVSDHKAFPDQAQACAAIVHMTHNSQEQGNALADVLLGDFNPSGRLVQTWPASLDQLPPMRDYDIRHGRTYQYFLGKPLYPFGFGLSYTSFIYADLQTSAEEVGSDGSITVHVDVTNTGARAGDEVVQMYVRYLHSSVERPEKQLVGFQRISLQPGETKIVTMALSAAQLAYWETAEHKFVVEEGKIQLLVGTSSAEIRQEKTLRVLH